MALRHLIVDDNETFLVAARDLLESEGGIVVGQATTSAEALRLAAELDPDVILVDIDLGEESGFELAQRLATEVPAPVVLISTYPEAEFTDLIAPSPAAGFISKSELSAAAVLEVLGSGSGGQAVP
jgi:two-component system, NarL family, nitrate/nitrite response regulator NarL